MVEVTGVTHEAKGRMYGPSRRQRYPLLSARNDRVFRKTCMVAAGRRLMSPIRLGEALAPAVRAPFMIKVSIMSSGRQDAFLDHESGAAPRGPGGRRRGYAG
ncbi:hypothetical protein GCM10010399_43220 [Dactylosporangium fulvum]